MKTTGARFTLSLETTKTTNYMEKIWFSGTGQQATKNSYRENEISLRISKVTALGVSRV